MTHVVNKSPTAGRARTLVENVTDGIHADGAAFVVAAVAFFLGSGVLTQSGQPGASTPAPWMVSHALWVVATVFVALGTISLVRRTPALAAGLAGYVAGGAFGVSVLHALQWTTWVYVDVIAYGHGAHDLLFDPVLHPFGTGHALMYGVLVGGGVACLGWGLTRTRLTPPALDRAGIAVGTAAVLAAGTSLLTFAPVRSPASLATILLLAVSYGWLFALGVVRSRGAELADTPQ